jgi:hypothetical protein
MAVKDSARVFTVFYDLQEMHLKDKLISHLILNQVSLSLSRA